MNFGSLYFSLSSTAESDVFCCGHEGDVFVIIKNLSVMYQVFLKIM